MAEVGVNYTVPTHPGSLAGRDKYYRSQTAGSRKQVSDWLRGVDSYTLHRPVRYRFPRNQVVVSSIDSQWDSDLASYINYAGDNDGKAYFLICIDILSHFIWTRALKTKRSREVADAMLSIFAEGRICKALRTDRGSEYTSKLFGEEMKQAGVKHFLTSNEVKASYAERAIKTVKAKLARFFTAKQTHRWVDVLQDVTRSYNNTYHRTIRRTPASVTVENASQVWQQQYDGRPGPKPDGAFKLQVGDFVRISHLRQAFQREYNARWSGEIFKVKARRVRGGLNIYSLMDWFEEPITGTFYEPELQKITADPEGVFNIEKVLRSRKRRGHEKEYLVRWQNWPSRFDSWVGASDMQDI